MEQAAGEMVPEICGECRHLHEATSSYGKMLAQCRAHAPLFTKHSKMGAFPLVEPGGPACGDAVPSCDIAVIRSERRIRDKIRGMRRCKFCHHVPYETDGHGGPYLLTNGDDEGIYMWCPNCNTTARGKTLEDAIDAWNRGEVENYDHEDEDA